MGAVGAASAVGGLAVFGHWLTHQRDALGRPRSLPVWTVSALLVFSVAAAIPGARRHVQEQKLSRIASALVGHRVSVHCQSFGQALTDLGSELGYVDIGPDGPEPSTLIKRDACTRLREYAGGRRAHPSADAVVAVHVLTHEAMHMRGLLNEAQTECAAVQRDATTAVLLGATASEGRALARRYWRTVYPRMPSDYQEVECAPGGAGDEGLATAPWAE